LLVLYTLADDIISKAILHPSNIKLFVMVILPWRQAKSWDVGSV